MRRFPLWLALAGLAITLALPLPAAAELPPLIPRTVLFGNPEKTNPQLSPDGSRLAYLAPKDKNVLQVYGAPINVGLTTSTGAPAYTVSGLQNNTTYYMAVTAYDLTGNESTCSAEGSKSISFQLTNLQRTFK